MTKILSMLLILAFSHWQALFAQASACDQSKFSESDKELIEQFWSDFKTAVNNKDKEKLASLIKFSLKCDYCILDSSKPKTSDFNSINKSSFDRTQYKIFYDPKFITWINQQASLFDALLITESGKKENCQLNFGYTSIGPTKDWEGQQHFFTIKKFNNRFLITTAWTIP